MTLHVTSGDLAERERWAFPGDTVFALYLERLSRCRHPLLVSESGEKILTADASDRSFLWRWNSGEGELRKGAGA